MHAGPGGYRDHRRGFRRRHTKRPAHGSPGLCVRVFGAGPHVRGAADTICIRPWEDALCKRPGYDLHADWALRRQPGVFRTGQFQEAAEQGDMYGYRKNIPPNEENPVHVEDHLFVPWNRHPDWRHTGNRGQYRGVHEPQCCFQYM